MSNITNLIENHPFIEKTAGWIFGLAIFVAAIFNLVLVHPVPAIAYLLLSLLYLPPATEWLKKLTGLSIPLLLKLIIAVFIILFTFGVSDLGDMID